MRLQTDPEYKKFRKDLDVACPIGRSLEKEYQAWCATQGISQTLRKKYRT